MLVVVSDLHFQEGARDVVRYTAAGQVRELGVEANVSAEALTFLFSEIHTAAARSGARRVDLVLAGDIFELHRTPRWFQGGPRALRPTSPIGPALEGKVLEILGAVLTENQPCWEALARFVSEKAYTRHGQALHLPEHVGVVEVHYLPGNHDRLVDLFPAARTRVRAALSIAAGAHPFPHVLTDRELGGAPYHARIRHGHEWDPVNVGAASGDPTTPYAAPALGDLVSVDVAAGLPAAFRARYARELRAESPRHRALYAALLQFEDVRPASELGRYLVDRFGARGGDELELLRPVIRAAAEGLLAHPFAAAELSRLGMFSGTQRAGLPLLLQHGPMTKVLEELSAMLGGSGVDGAHVLAEAAREPGVADGPVELVVVGHTHRPSVRPLPGKRAPTLVDTGTWRTAILSGPGAFQPVRATTFVFGYDDVERATFLDRRRFETWTGYLASDRSRDAGEGAFGPRDVACGPPTGPAQTVRFVALEVVTIDEGDTGDGAELQLTFGVDGVGETLSATDVKDGQHLSLDRAVPAHPALDGDVWCFGVERDLGTSGAGALVDADDPLPWGLDALPRSGADRSAPFALGPHELHLQDGAKTHLILRYEVS